MGDEMSAQLIIETKVIALSHQDIVDRSPDGPIAIGVPQPPLLAICCGEIFYRAAGFKL
jgi:hypothetical protein